MNRTDIFLIHGIGKTIGTGYYDRFVLSLRRYLPIDLDLNFHTIDYSPLLETKEDTIFSWMEDLGWVKLRRFACDFVCDVLAFAYTRRPAQEGDFIFDLTKLLKDKFSEINTRYPDSRKIIIGHSLGSIVGFGYTWEEKIDTLITMGSPFDYFSIRYKGFGEMNLDLRVFYNFWKRFDVVSTIISRNPNFRCVKDIQVKTFNPKYIFPVKAHTSYWESEFVHQEIAKIILESSSPTVKQE